MKVSVIIPVYNVSQYIDRCLLSVANQTYSDIECILVDDCGRDDSVAKCESFISKYKGNIYFSIIHHAYNRGLSAARNTGFVQSTGDYVYYMDSDDELPDDAIEILVDKVNEHPGVDMVQGFTVSVPHDEYYDSSCFADCEYATDNRWIRYQYYKIGQNIPINGWDKLLRRDFINDNKLFFKEGVIHEDEHWMWFVVQRISTMAFVFKPTYIHYYLNEGGIIATTTIEKTSQNMKLIVFDLLNHFDNVMLPMQIQKIIWYYNFCRVYRVCTKEENMYFARTVSHMLWSERQYLSWLCFNIWFMLPLGKGLKLLRLAMESIQKSYTYSKLIS